MNTRYGRNKSTPVERPRSTSKQSQKLWRESGTFPCFTRAFHSRISGNDLGFSQYSIAHFLQKVNTNDCSKVHFQDKCMPQCVIVQSEVFRVYVAIFPIYAESLMIQVIRPFLIYAVVIYI